MYPDVMEARVKFQKHVTLEHMDTIVDYRYWHQYAIVNHNEYVEELVFRGLRFLVQGPLSVKPRS